MRKNDSIKACGRTINYEIVYSKKRRKAAIVVRPDLSVEFRAPPHGSAVRLSGRWYRRKLPGCRKNWTGLK